MLKKDDVITIKRDADVKIKVYRKEFLKNGRNFQNSESPKRT
jgi:hypothetical protein